MEITFDNNGSSIAINEYEVEKILQDNKLFACYKDIHGYHRDLTSRAVGFFTKKKFSYKKEIIGKTEYDVFDKRHWKLIELYERHDGLAYQHNVWHGIEPGHLDGTPIFAEVIKKPVVDRQGKMVGTLYNTVPILNQSFNKSIVELLQFINPLAGTKNLCFEFCETNPSRNLTNREMECLFYTIRGKTAKAIARTLNISSKTVEFHIEHLKTKFSCHCKSELISKAIEMGYLDKISKSIFSY